MCLYDHAIWLTPDERRELVLAGAEAVCDLTDKGGIYYLVDIRHGQRVLIGLHRGRQQAWRPAGKDSNSWSTDLFLKMFLHYIDKTATNDCTAKSRTVSRVTFVKNDLVLLHME